MFNTRLAKVLFYIMLTISVIVPLFLYPQLPERIASHFGINNMADGWMNKSTYLFAHFLIIFLLTTTFVGMGIFMHKLPFSLFNLPNKNYWMDEKRKEGTLEVLKGMLYWTGSLCLILFIYVFYQVYKANINSSGRIDSFSWFAVIIFLMANGIVIIKYISYFNKKNE